MASDDRKLREKALTTEHFLSILVRNRYRNRNVTGFDTAKLPVGYPVSREGTYVTKTHHR